MQHDPDLELRTERLRLRKLKLADAARIAELAGDFDVARMTSRIPHPYSLVAADQWIGGLDDNEIVWAIEHQQGLIGVCGFVRGVGRVAEIGYWIGKPYWGFGFATEAARALVAYCFETADIRRLTCIHYADNAGSARVARKLGFRRTGTGSTYCQARSEDVATITYALRRPALAIWRRVA